MQEILTQEYIFDNGFKCQYEKCNIRNILRYSVKENYLTEEEKNEIFEGIKESIINYAISNYDIDDDFDINLYVEENTQQVIEKIDNYLEYLNNPSLGLKKLVNELPKLIIESNKFYEETKLRINNKIDNLFNSSKLICNYNKEFNTYIVRLKKILNNESSAFDNSFYTSLNEVLINDLYDLENQIDSIQTEIDIINKFDKEELTQMFKYLYGYIEFNENASYLDLDNTNLSSVLEDEFELDHEKNSMMEKLAINTKIEENYGKNITLMVLHNYIINMFFKDSSSIIITDSMNKLLKENNQIYLIDEEDAQSIITYGKIRFNEKELEYINKYFIPVFEASKKYGYQKTLKAHD